MNNERLIFNEGSSVKHLNLTTLEIIGEFESNLKTVSLVALSPDGKSVAIAGRQGASLIDISTQFVTNLSKSKIMSLAFSPNGKMLALGYQLTLHAPQSTSLEIWLNQESGVSPKKTNTKPNKKNDSFEPPWWDNF